MLDIPVLHYQTYIDNQWHMQWHICRICHHMGWRKFHGSRSHIAAVPAVRSPSVPSIQRRHRLHFGAPCCAHLGAMTPTHPLLLKQESHHSHLNMFQVDVPTCSTFWNSSCVLKLDALDFLCSRSNLGACKVNSNSPMEAVFFAHVKRRQPFDRPNNHCNILQHSSIIRETCWNWFLWAIWPLRGQFSTVHDRHAGKFPGYLVLKGGKMLKILKL